MRDGERRRAIPGRRRSARDVEPSRMAELEAWIISDAALVPSCMKL